VQGTLADVVEVLRDCIARHLAETTITKFTTIFEKQFLAWTRDAGMRYLKELTPARLTAWRSTWKDQSVRGVEEVPARRQFLLLLHAYEVDRGKPDEGPPSPESKAGPDAPVHPRGGERDRLCLRPLSDDGHLRRA
jgi:hypothetical protein